MFFIKKYHYVSDFESTDTSTTKPVDWERRKQYIPKRFILSCISVVFFTAILAENLFNTWANTFFQYQPVLHVSASTAADIMSASNGAFSFGRLVSVFIAFYVKPAYMIIVQMFIALAGYVYLYFGQNVMLNLWLSAVVVGLGFSTIWICLFTFVGRYMPLTDRIGGWFIGPCNISYIVLCYFISELIQTDPNVYLYINIAGVVVGIIAFSVAWYSGITQSMEGPAFVEFTYTTNSSLSLIGLVPALQGVGMFFGSLCMGSWNGCNYVVLIEMWTYRSPQMILWSQVFWSVGAIIGPLITQNFVISAIAYFGMYFIKKYNYTKTTDTTDTTCADIAERRKRVIPKYFILGCISVVQLTAIMVEYSYLAFSATFYQYQPVLLVSASWASCIYQPVLLVSASWASCIVSMQNGAFALSRLVSIFIASYVKPSYLIIVGLIVALAGYVFMILGLIVALAGYVFMILGQNYMSTLIASALVIALGFSLPSIYLFSYLGRYMTVTDRISGWIIGPCNMSYIDYCLFINELKSTDTSTKSDHTIDPKTHPIPKYLIIASISIVQLTAVMSEQLFATFTATFYQYLPVLNITASKASTIVSAQNGMLALGRMIGGALIISLGFSVPSVYLFTFVD
ncbi:unnamed protein product, partial [Oppiella nova]